jgi:hypothetical protein
LEEVIMADLASPTAGRKTLTTSAQDLRTQETYDLIASNKVEGTAVRRPDGESIGQIERLMIEKRSGRVAYAVMSFGGFLGIGSDFYPIPWSMLKYNEQLDAYELDVDDDRLRAAPHFADSTSIDWSDRQRGQEIYDYYGVTPYWGL